MVASEATSVVLYGLVFLFGAINAHTFGEFKAKTEQGTVDSCYVCNSAIEDTKCDHDDKDDWSKVKKINCKTDFMKTVYGMAAMSEPASTELFHWPRTLSHLANQGGPSTGPSPSPSPSPGANETNNGRATAEEENESTTQYGWTFGNVLYKKNDEYQGYRYSSFEGLMQQKKFEGFRSCAKITITISTSQKNGGRDFLIEKKNPRYIRTCSFGDPNEGCKTYLYKEGAEVTACFCNKNNCNSSSYMRVSHWMFVAVLIAIFGQWMIE